MKKQVSQDVRATYEPIRFEVFVLPKPQDLLYTLSAEAELEDFEDVEEEF